MLAIKDRPGFISTALMRHYFEGAIKQTAVLNLNVPLGCDVEADGAVTYHDPRTHAMWVGWALGMRCAQRIEMEQSAQDAGIVGGAFAPALATTQEPNP